MRGSSRLGTLAGGTGCAQGQRRSLFNQPRHRRALPIPLANRIPGPHGVPKHGVTDKITRWL